MKKTLLLLGFVLATIAANAQTLFGTSLSNNTTQKERVLKAPSKAALHRLSVPKDEKPTYNPEGEDEATSWRTPRTTASTRSSTPTVR